MPVWRPKCTGRVRLRSTSKLPINWQFHALWDNFITCWPFWGVCISRMTPLTVSNCNKNVRRSGMAFGDREFSVALQLRRRDRTILELDSEKFVAQSLNCTFHGQILPGHQAARWFSKWFISSWVVIKKSTFTSARKTQNSISLDNFEKPKH